MSNDKAVDEEDLPIHERPRVKAWAASKMGHLPRPVLGSSERAVLLESAKCLDEDADVLYEKIKVLRKEAELLREEAFQKRVLCAPIRSIPPETLSQILVLATHESFAFRPSAETDAHPLSAVSRGWRHIIETTPEIWSKIDILLPGSYHSNEVRQDAPRRLRPWLARASNTNLKVTFELRPMGAPSPSLEPLQTACLMSQSMWLMLLSLVGNWREFSYRGTSTFLNHFWEKAHCAVRLETASFLVHDAQHLNTEDLAGAKPLACNLNLFPRLHTLVLSGYFPSAFIREQLPFATRLQTLTLRNVPFSNSGLAGLAASFPFVTKFHLQDVAPPAPEASTSHAVAFERLEHFELSRSMYSEQPTVLPALPALQGCRALKSLRLQFAEFLVPEGSQPLSSVERLELELATYPSPDEPEPLSLFAMLPSLKSLHVAPSGPEWRVCDAEMLVEELLFSGAPDGPPLCPQLLEISFQRATVSNLVLVTFVEKRTFNAAPDALKILEEYSEELWKQDPNRSTRYEEWKPTCVVTTSNCPGTPDMVDADLQVLVDSIKSGKLQLDEPDEEDLECDADCACDCGDVDCPCCEHLGVSDEEDPENYLGDENFSDDEVSSDDDELFINGF